MLFSRARRLKTPARAFKEFKKMRVEPWRRPRGRNDLGAS